MPAWIAFGAKSRTSVAGAGGALAGSSAPPQPASDACGRSRISTAESERIRVIRGRSIGTRAESPDTTFTQERKDPVEPKGARAYVAELVGTFVLVLFICLVVSLSSRAALGFTDWSVIGLVHAFTLALLVASLAGVCGAHFNPAVTISMLATKRIRGGDAGVYILMQLAGATLAALVCKWILIDEGKPVNYGATLLTKAFFQSDSTGFIAEMLGTFLLMATITGTAVIAKNKSDITPWLIGGALGVGGHVHRPADGRRLQPGARVRPDARVRTRCSTTSGRSCSSTRSARSSAR